MKKSLVLVCLMAAAVALQGADAPPQTLAVPGRANANVSLAADRAFVAAVWSAALPGGATDIYAAVSSNAGAQFSSPVRVNVTAGEANVNGEQPPRVALVARAGATPAIVVVWTAKGVAGTALLVARSTDGGRTFSRASRVPGSEAAGNRGWESIVVGRNGAAGTVGIVWLDHRETASGDMSHHMEAQLSKIYFASLGDGAPPARAIAGGVCYCCKTAVTSGADGSLYTAWRHVYPGNLRDIAFSMSRDGGRGFAEPVRVSQDKWAIDGCPENGPTIGVDGANRIHIVWPTLVPGSGRGTDSLGLFHASSRDGRQFTPRQAIPTEGVPRHPQMVVAADGSLVLVWDETAGGRRIVAASGRAGSDGRLQIVRHVVSSAAGSIYPAVAATNGGALVAWTSGVPPRSVIRVERVTNDR